MRVLVAGATGAIGEPLVRRLRDGGHDVLALGRSAEKLERLGVARCTRRGGRGS